MHSTAYAGETLTAKADRAVEGSEKVLGSLNIALGNLNARLYDDVSRLEDLPSRLFGPMAESARSGGEDAVPQPAGTLGDLSMTREVTDNLLERLMRVTNSLVQLA